MGTIYFMFLTAVLSIRVVPMTYSSVKTVLGKCMIQKFSLIILICKSLFYVHYLLSVFNIINLKWGFGVPRSVSLTYCTPEKTLFFSDQDSMSLGYTRMTEIFLKHLSHLIHNLKKLTSSRKTWFYTKVQKSELSLVCSYFGWIVNLKEHFLNF